ncbi:MAG: hypothetical protein ACI9CA_000982 [Natronomonas sp.]
MGSEERIMRDRPLLSMLVVALVVVGVAGLVAVAAPVGAQTADKPGANAMANSSVNVTAGAQLSTVLSVTSDDVQSEVKETAFEVEYEREEGRAKVVAERADALRDRAEDIREDYRAAVEAYRQGEVDRAGFAQRLAALNARAGSVVNAHDRLERRAATLSTFDLRVAGFNRTGLEQAVTPLEDVRGTGATALLAQFTGQQQGEISLETDGGLSIEVSSEDGERSREFEREPDDDATVSVSQSTALETARGALTDTGNGSWALTDADIDSEDGAYAFGFELRADGLTGEAEVGVDGSSGEVVSLEEEVEPADDREDSERADELALVVTDGQPAPGATVTVRTLAGGDPAADIAVGVDGEMAGETAADGTLTLTLPDTSEVTLTAERGGAEAELEFEFEVGDSEQREQERFRGDVDVSATLADGTVAVTATYNGSGIADATVSANGERVGVTDASGRLDFALPADAEDLELEVTKGSFEAEAEYAVRNGSLAAPGEDQEHADQAPEEQERDEDNSTADDGGTDDGETETLELVVDGGDPGPGETVTLRVLADGDPAADTTVLVNDERVGATDDEGRVTVTLPDVEDVEVTAETGGETAELEFEFDDRGAEDTDE